MKTRADWDAMLLSSDVAEKLSDYELSGELHRDGLVELEQIVGFGGGTTGHKDLWGHTCQVVAQTIPSILVRWAALYHDVGKPRCYTKVGGEVKFIGHEAVSARQFEKFAKRAGFFSTDELETVSFLIRHLGQVEEYDPSWTDSAVRRLYKVAGAHFEDLVALARADITTKHQNLRKAHHVRMHDLRTRAEELARLDAIPQALVKGLGPLLMEAYGLPAGPALGVLMRNLKEDVERGDLPRQAEADVVIAFALKKYPK